MDHWTTVKGIEEVLYAKNLRRSRPRHEIITAFIKARRHLTAEELYLRVRTKHPRIGSATVYRTLRLMCNLGLCKELNFEKGGGRTRYELVKGREHHDHLICTRCGAVVEVFDAGIEKLQDRLFKRYGYQPQSHRFELYGICTACQGGRMR